MPLVAIQFNNQMWVRILHRTLAIYRSGYASEYAIDWYSFYLRLVSGTFPKTTQARPKSERFGPVIELLFTGPLRVVYGSVTMLRFLPCKLVTSNMADFQGKGGCPCTDEKQFPELYYNARRCEFDLYTAMDMFSNRCSFWGAFGAPILFSEIGFCMASCS